MIIRHVYAAASTKTFGNTGGLFRQANGSGTFEYIAGSSAASTGAIIANNGDIYELNTSNIRIQVGGVGDFVEVPGTTGIHWYGGASLRNGDVYFCSAEVHKVFKRTGGVGDVVDLGLSTTPFYYAMSADPQGAIYLATSNGMYKMPYGGAFALMNDITARYWIGVAATPWGDVYATCDDVGSKDIYKQTAGAGDFIALNQGALQWTGITCGPDGNVYACVWDGSLYKQTGGAGNFVDLSQTRRDWRGMAAGSLNAYAPRSYGTIIG